ncbi:hypothetical protein [Desulfitobacterium metallireducens]|uniref:Uncharacterized protein n=1 Tax=Desulfitobacterium metallireducens DSM 15288 TaxID=871968 RepID=W0ECV9_9FIRM|nr:hypothetical protein DESME_10195 [Desulfitobacterium metallireducens DSM 15288]
MAISIILAILLVILVLILGTTVALITRGKTKVGASENSDQEHPERSKNMIRVVYTYVILFATLMMTIGGSVAAFMAIADLVSPPGYYQTFEEYKVMGVEGKQPSSSTVGLNEDILRENYNQMIADDKKRAQDRAMNSLIKSFGWIVIPLPIFLYYQRRLKQE